MKQKKFINYKNTPLTTKENKKSLTQYWKELNKNKRKDEEYKTFP